MHVSINRLIEAIMTSADHEPADRSVREDRHRDLVRAAYGLIASAGFEGLRTRGIAEAAGVNIATLHYYFPTKEALIGGVAEYLASLFITVHAPPVEAMASSALTRLRQELADVKFYGLERRDMLTVMDELRLRARRDPAVARVIAPLIGHWRAGIRKLIVEGLAEGVFRAGLDPATAADVVAATLTGALDLGLDEPALDRLAATIEDYLIAPERGAPTIEPGDPS
jgi:AcrR family transcriptional regulator